MVKNLDEIVWNIKSNQLNNLEEVQSALNSLKPYTHAENKNDEILKQCYGIDENLKPELFEVIEVVILDKLLEVVSNIKTGGIDQALKLLKKYKIVFNPRGEGAKYFFYPPDEINQSNISSSNEKNIWGKIITNTDYYYPQKIKKLNEFITQLEKNELPRGNWHSVLSNSEMKPEKVTENTLSVETEINQTTPELSDLEFSEDWKKTVGFNSGSGFVREGKTWGGRPVENDNEKDQKLEESDLHKDLEIKEITNDEESDTHFTQILYHTDKEKVKTVPDEEIKQKKSTIELPSAKFFLKIVLLIFFISSFVTVIVISKKKKKFNKK